MARNARQITIDGSRATINLWGQVTIHRREGGSWLRVCWFEWPHEAVHYLEQRGELQLAAALANLRELWLQRKLMGK
jgi:hypothetical protein